MIVSYFGINTLVWPDRAELSLIEAGQGRFSTGRLENNRASLISNSLLPEINSVIKRSKSLNFFALEIVYVFGSR
jgi:hypothetical protein